jgi:ATP synthase protein I
MNEQDKENGANKETEFSRQIGEQAARKLKAQRGTKRSIWYGLGLSGLIGWSVTVPTLIGAAIGIWVDKHYASGFSWTLMLLLLGLALGCLNAWHWVASEYKEIKEDPDE